MYQFWVIEKIILSYIPKVIFIYIKGDTNILSISLFLSDEYLKSVIKVNDPHP